MRSAVVACLGALALAFPVQANTIRVPGDQPVIQAGLDAASAGDTVLVAPGTYAGPGNRNLSFNGRDLVLISEAGAEATIIDGEESAVGIEFRNAETLASIVEGFTFANCTTGIHCAHAPYPPPPLLPSEATVRHCILNSCTVSIHSDEGGHVSARYCEMGGTVGAGLGLEISTWVILDHCVLTRASGIGGRVTVTNSTFVDIDRPDATLLRISEGSINITDCAFMDNNLQRLASAGASIFAGAHINLSRCTFIGNNGCNTSLGYRGYLDITECTFTGNDWFHLLFGHGEPEGAYLTLNNNIIAFNTGGPVAGDLVSVSLGITCCDIYGNEGGDWVGRLANYYGINGNICEDPLFCDAPNRDFTLDADSPCAPEHSGGCGLIGAWPVGCGATSVPLDEASSPWIGLRVHPNPIRTSGIVEWMSEVGAPAVLRLYDPKGRLVFVRRLHTGGSGLHHVTWTDLLGNRELRSGVYYLELGGQRAHHETQRVVVIR